MRISHGKFFLAACAAATMAGALATTQPAAATNLLVDPGFNQGTIFNEFQGWTVSGGATPIAYDSPLPCGNGGPGVCYAPLPSSIPLGSKFAIMESYGTTTVFQTVSVPTADVGRTLTFSLFYDNDGSDPNFGPDMSALTLDVNGKTLSFSPVPNTQGLPAQYGQVSVTTTAQASNYVAFSGSDPTAYYTVAYPDLELGPKVAGGVPEPAAWTLMLIGFGGLGASVRFRRRQIASKSAHC